MKHCSPLHSLLLLIGFALIAACSNKAPKTASVAKPVPVKQVRISTPIIPSNMRILDGSLSVQNGTLPAGGDIELALLAVNGRGCPQQMLASEKIAIATYPQSFRLLFNPNSFPRQPGLTVELHGRAVQSGRLLWTLPPVRIQQPNSQSLGMLFLVPAP